MSAVSGHLQKALKDLLTDQLDVYASALLLHFCCVWLDYASLVQGYSESWSANGTRLSCIDEQQASNRTITIVVACVASFAGAVILFALLLVWLLYLRTKPRWLRERIMQGKRTCGAPRCTKPGEKVTVSIVVTDVKDFSELTRHYPELMSKAMGGHNNILRKACHAHAGYVLDQEGDSWAVAFYDAEDACGFSLQVCRLVNFAVVVLFCCPEEASACPASALPDTLGKIVCRFCNSS